MKEKNALIGFLDNNFLVRIVKSEDAARLLFQKVAVDRSRTHHNDLLFQSLAPVAFGSVLGFCRFDLVVERDQAQIAALSGDQVIAEIKGQADPDHDDQVLAEQVFLFDESLHPTNESQRIPRVKQNPNGNQRVMWVQFRNETAKRFF